MYSRENPVSNCIFTATKILSILSAICAIFISYAVSIKKIVTKDHWGDPKIKTVFSMPTFLIALIAFAITIFIILLVFYAIGEIIRLQQETLNVLSDIAKGQKAETTKEQMAETTKGQVTDKAKEQPIISNASCKPLIDTWECESCGHVNDASSLSCTNCGMRK